MNVSEFHPFQKKRGKKQKDQPEILPASLELSPSTELFLFFRADFFPTLGFPLTLTLPLPPLSLLRFWPGAHHPLSS